MARGLELVIPAITHHGRPIINYPHLLRLPETYPILVLGCPLQGEFLRPLSLCHLEYRGPAREGVACSDPECHYVVIIQNLNIRTALPGY